MQALVRHAPWLAALVLLSCVPAGWIASGIETNNTIHTFVAQGDPGLAFYRQTTERFGGDLLVFVSMDTGERGVFAPHSLARLGELTDAVTALDGVARVSSLANVETVVHEGGAAVVGPLLEPAPRTVAEAAVVEQRVFESMLLPWYVSPDRRATLVVAEVEPDLGPVQTNAVVRSIRAAAAAIDPGGADVALAGNPVVAEAIDRFNGRDQQLFSGLMLLLVAVASWLWLRRAGAAMLPVAVVLVVVLWTTALFVAAGHQTNWVTAIISPILFLIGVASAVHFLALYQEAARTAATTRDAVERALGAVALPCLFTSLTTAVGFASLLANQIMPVRVFGLFAAIGVMLALVATLVLLPAGLRLLGAGAARPATATPVPPRALLAVDALAQRHPWIVLAAAGALAGAVSAGVGGLRVETNMLSYFRDDAEVVRHSLEIERVYGGAAPLDIVVDSGREDGALDPGLLAGISDLQRRLEAMDGAARGLSLADLLIDVRRASTGDLEAGLPRSEAEAAQLLLLPDPEVVDLVVDFERRSTRISTRFAGAGRGLKWSRGLLADVEEACAETLGDHAEVTLTGSSVLFVHMDRYLVTGQVRSLAIVLLLITGIMMALFGSVRVGLLAMIPNVLPIAMMLGLMGWLDLPLDGLTVMIACIAIGIGVDDTIHYLVHLRREMRAGATAGQAMTRTISSVGRAIVFTSAVLALGFGVFATSDFVGTRNFGLLTALTVVVALVADLLVLPAALTALGVPRGWGRPR
jgi:uncharacterized protein